MTLSDLEKRVLGLINEQELVKLAVDMGNIYSPAGDEEHMAAFVVDWLRSNGIESREQEVVKGRNNVVGLLRGSGGGSSLLFNSHMDLDVGGPGEEWTLPDPGSAHITKAWVEGDKIFGKAVLNDRGPMAAFMMAAKAIRESGVRLKGDLLLTMVVGEIGMAPIDEFQGTRYVGKGLGSKHLVNHGIVADYVLVAETTDFGVTWVEAGAAYIKITLKGDSIYTPRSYRTDRVEDHPNAIVKMAHFVRVLEEWGAQYEEENTYTSAAGKMVPKVAIGAIRGGVPYKPYRTSGVCSIYIDVRIPPGKRVLDIKRQLEALAQSVHMVADVQIYLYRAGYEGLNVAGIVQAVEGAHEKVLQRKPPPVPVAVTSMWRDINVFNEVGIPAVTFGPPRHSADDGVKFMQRDDLVNVAKMYALVAMDICGVKLADPP